MTFFEDILKEDVLEEKLNVNLTALLVPLVPDAVQISLLFVVLEVPVTAIKPKADGMSLLLVTESVPIIVVDPEALEVSFRLV